MSIHRISPKAGWCDQRKLLKGPNGRNLCRQCGEEVPSCRRTFCSERCVDEWNIRTNPGFARRKVFERDKGVCCLCGVDTVAVEQELRELRGQARRLLYGHDDSGWVHSYLGRLYDDTPFGHRIHQLWLPRHLRGLTQSLWEMDHARPVSEGGGECGLDNLRTLCWACHAKATRELAKRRARWWQLELALA